MGKYTMPTQLFLKNLWNVNSSKKMGGGKTLKVMPDKSANNKIKKIFF